MVDPTRTDDGPLTDELRESMAAALGMDVDEGWLAIALTLMEQAVTGESPDRMWTLPVQPGPEVTAVRAVRRDGSLGPYWHREETAGHVHWVRYHNNADPSTTGYARDVKPWAELFALHGPDGYPIKGLITATDVATRA